MKLSTLIKKGKHFAKLAAQSYMRVNHSSNNRNNGSYQQDSKKDKAYKYRYNATVYCAIDNTEYSYYFYFNEQNKPYGFVCDCCGENWMFKTPTQEEKGIVMSVGDKHTICFN